MRGEGPPVPHRIPRTAPAAAASPTRLLAVSIHPVSSPPSSLSLADRFLLALPPPGSPPPPPRPSRPSVVCIMAPSHRTLSSVAASAVAVTAVLAFATSIGPAAATPITDDGAVAAALPVAAPAAVDAAEWQAVGAVGDDAATDWEPAAVVGDALVDEAAANDGDTGSDADVDEVARTADDVEVAVRDENGMEMESAVIGGDETADETDGEGDDDDDDDGVDDNVDADVAKEAAEGKVEVRTMDEELTAEDDAEAKAEMAEDKADADAADAAEPM